MPVISASSAQQTRTRFVNKSTKTRSLVNQENPHNVVISSLDDYNSWRETNYLLSNHYNAERLLNSLKKARAGEVFERTLIE